MLVGGRDNELPRKSATAGQTLDLLPLRASSFA